MGELLQVAHVLPAMPDHRVELRHGLGNVGGDFHHVAGENIEIVVLIEFELPEVCE